MTICVALLPEGRKHTIITNSMLSDCICWAFIRGDYGSMRCDFSAFEFAKFLSKSVFLYFGQGTTVKRLFISSFEYGVLYNRYPCELSLCQDALLKVERHGRL